MSSTNSPSPAAWKSTAPKCSKRLQEGGQKILAEGERAAKAAAVPVETKLFESFGDRLADLVAKDAVEWNADLIVLGTHGRRGLRRALLGSDAEQVARHVTVPVLLLRPKRRVRSSRLAASGAVHSPSKRQNENPGDDGTSRTLPHPSQSRGARPHCGNEKNRPHEAATPP